MISRSAAPAALLAILQFWAYITFATLQRFRGPDGWIKLDDRNLSLAVYSIGGPYNTYSPSFFCVGTSNWNNVAEIKVKRLYGFKYYCFKFLDLDAFLKGKDDTTDKAILKKARSGARLHGFASVIVKHIPLFGNIYELLLRAIGYSGLPSSNKDKDLLEWNGENYHCHVLTPASLMPCDDLFTALIEKHRTAQTSAQTENLLHPRAEEIALNDNTIEHRLKRLHSLIREDLITDGNFLTSKQRILGQL